MLTRLNLRALLAVSVRSFKENFWKLVLVGLLLGLITIGSALLVESFIPDLAELRQYGYLGTFLIGFGVNATLLFPPVLMGATLPPVVDFANHANLFWVAVTYAFGATLGESVGYGVGMESKRLLRFLGFFRQRNHGESETSSWIERLLRGKKSWFWLVALTILPFPPFDVAGLIAGGLRYPFRKFFTACLVGRIGKYLIVFSVGGLVWSWMVRVWHIVA